MRVMLEEVDHVASRRVILRFASTAARVRGRGKGTRKTSPTVASGPSAHAAGFVERRVWIVPADHAAGSRPKLPGLPYWLARRRERGELRGKNSACFTSHSPRARDLLILIAAENRKISAVKWENAPERLLEQNEIVDARSHLDWLLLWLPQVTKEENWSDALSGRNEILRWRIYASNDPVFANRTSVPVETAAIAEKADEAAVEKVSARLAWQYPFAAATTEPAKTSVSVLRRRQRDESDDEARPLFQFRSRRRARDGALSAAEAGTAHHLFLQFVALDGLDGLGGVKAEADRMHTEGILTTEALAALDLAALTHFWQSEFGGESWTARSGESRNSVHGALFGRRPFERGIGFRFSGRGICGGPGCRRPAVILPEENLDSGLQNGRGGQRIIACKGEDVRTAVEVVRVGVVADLSKAGDGVRPLFSFATDSGGGRRSGRRPCLMWVWSSAFSGPVSRSDS
jgi:hypothetical protein